MAAQQLCHHNARVAPRFSAHSALFRLFGNAVPYFPFKLLAAWPWRFQRILAKREEC
jgi:hypothetical protein